jgi:hypothetical protein
MVIKAVFSVPSEPAGPENANIIGHIRNSQTGQPISDVEIIVWRTDIEYHDYYAITDKNGNYSLSVPAGFSYEAAAMASGYVRQDTSITPPGSLNFDLAPKPLDMSLLKRYQESFNEAQLMVNAGYPDGWVYMDTYGLRPAYLVLDSIRPLMIQEAVRLGIISSGSEVTFQGTHMYKTDGTLII